MKIKKLNKNENSLNSLLTPFEAEKANNLHKDILNKINNILHRKTHDENFTNKLKKSTVLCFDDLSINDNEGFIDEKIEEFLKILKKEVGDLVDFNQDRTKESNMNNRFQDAQFVSKFILNKAFVRENTVIDNLFEDNKYIKNSLLKKGFYLNNLDLKDDKATNNLKQLMSKIFKHHPKTISDLNSEKGSLHKRINSIDVKQKNDFFLTNLETKKYNSQNKKENLEIGRHEKLFKPKSKFLHSENQNHNHSPQKSRKLNNLNDNKHKIVTKKISDLDLNKHSHSVPSFLNKFRKNNSFLNQDFLEIKEKDEKSFKRSPLHGMHGNSPVKKVFGKNIQDLKENTSNGFFLTNSTSIVSKPKNNENGKNDVLNFLNEKNSKREKFSLHIDSRPHKSIFFVELIQKKKAEKLAKIQKIKKNENLIKNNKNPIDSPTPFIRKENKFIMEGIKKRTGSIDGITNNLYNRSSNNFYKKNIKASVKPEFQIFNHVSPLIHPTSKIECKKSGAESSGNLFEKKSDNLDENQGTDKAKTFTSGFKISKETNRNLMPSIYKETNKKINENLKKVLVNSANIKHELNDLYSLEQNTTVMRYELIRNHEQKLSQQNYDFLTEQKESKQRNNVKGIYNIDSGEMVYIDENKANIINHIDTILKMRNENFYKFRRVCVEKYKNYARQNDIFEYVFGNARYMPKRNYHKIDDNTFKLRRLYENMKNTSMNIKKFFEEKNKET